MSDPLPKYAYLIVRILVSPRDLEGYLGDLEQKYQAKKGKQGMKQANAWLRREMIMCMGPLLALRVYMLVKFAKILKETIEKLME